MEIIKRYFAKSEKERSFKNKMIQLFESKGPLAFTRENLDAHFTASAWILNVNTRSVLLLHHKKLNKWLQPGGHADGEMDLEKVARKEAKEETNLDNLTLYSHNIFDIDIHLIPERKGIPTHYHYDVRFAYFCPDKERTQINHESNSYKWIKTKDIKTLTNESSILRMAQKSKSILDEK